MATLLDYFNNDFNFGSSLENRKIISFQKRNAYDRIIGEEKVEIIEKLCLHGITSSRLPCYYINTHPETLSIICAIIDRIGKPDRKILNIDLVISSVGDNTAGIEKTTYTSRLYFYIETSLKENELKQLDKFCKTKGVFATLRSFEYLEIKMKLDKPKAFISHDSRDKELIAKRIATGLSSRLCPVWYDEFSLKVGDSLRDSIEKGIKEANKCILILTPNFLNNPGWGKKEFQSIFSREIIEEKRIIIPIWYNVSKKDIYEYSPSLVDTFALIWPDKGTMTDNEYKEKFKVEFEEIITKIHAAIL